MNVYNSSRTIYNIKLQTCMMAGLPYVALPNTTLNEKFDILQYEQFKCVTKDCGYPRINGIVIGNGGVDIINSDIVNLKMGKHSPVDAALYNHIPFIIRPVDEDLELDFRTKYRLRVEEAIGGTRYALYYMKLYDDFFYDNNIYVITGNEVIPSAKIFNTYRNDLLNPSPLQNNDLVMMEDTPYIVNIFRIPFQLNEDDINELNNVFNILNIKDRIITEIGITTGIDYTLPDGYPESILTQIGFFVDVSLDLQLLDIPQVEFEIELGGGEMLPLRIDVNAT